MKGKLTLQQRLILPILLLGLVTLLSNILAVFSINNVNANAGVIVEHEPMEKTCERFIDYVIKVASGEFVNNEKKNYREIAIFKTGVTL